MQICKPEHGHVLKTREKRKASSELVAAIRQCSRRRDLEAGRKLHMEAIAASCQHDKYVTTVLITMYSKCESMLLARKVFDGMTDKDVVAWTSLILGYVENGQSSEAMKVFESMECEPNAFTYVAFLKACAASRETEKGIAIHRELQDRGFLSQTVVANALLNMYGKCGSMQRAKEVFDRMTHKDVVTWTSIIQGYVENGESSMAMEIYEAMNCEANRVTYIAVLKACASLASERETEKSEFLEKGIAIHKQIRKHGFDLEVPVANTLIDMYGKCGSMKHAQQVFEEAFNRSVVTWNCLIIGYVENGESSVALELFTRMNCEPDRITYIAALRACAIEKELEKGTGIHREVKARGFDRHIHVANTLVDMYGKCGSMQRAQEAFDMMTHRDVVTWNCLILGYVDNGESSVALDWFVRMDCEPDRLTYICVLKACGSLGELQLGPLIHGELCRLGLERDRVVANALVDFYCKCRRIDAAEELFCCMHSPDIVSWTALMAGYSLLWESTSVLSLASRIHEAGLRMNTITINCILRACGQAGLVDEGKKCFEYMRRHGIEPTLEHYICMVDMLGRANMLEDALSMVKNMPLEANAGIWATLLEWCGKWNNVEVSKVARDALTACNTNHAAAYMVMSGSSTM